MARSEYRKKKKKDYLVFRLRLLSGVLILVGLAIIGRLFVLMVIKHDFYAALAKGSHEVYSKLVPQRGSIYMEGADSSENHAVALNKDYFLVFANSERINNRSQAETSINKVSQLISLSKPQRKQQTSTLKQKEQQESQTQTERQHKEKEIKQNLIDTLANKKDDPYIPIKKKVPIEKAKQMKEKQLTGINTVRRSYRYYPEAKFAGPVLGFVGKTEAGEKKGRYGAEGYWDSKLAGKGGFLEGVKSASGFWIPTVSSEIQQPEDGADIYLTIDRAIQYKACQRLEQARKRYKAEKASLVVMDPKTGAVKAMCSKPDFNPNKYQEVDSINRYNNSTIYTPYEVGSIFKSLVMASALEEDVLEPDTPFKDPGQIKGICSTPIRNSREKVYDKTDMTGVLEKSINTGMVQVAKELGKEDLVHYIEQFGFGTKTGIRLNQERAGDISSLYKSDSDKIGCYAATASFGQGITATPIQMAAAYSALANKGKLPRPYVVKKVKYENGNVETRGPKTIRKIFRDETISLIKGMLTSVVKKGHAKTAGHKGYYV
ncbi:MAG: hypothetical protein BRC22_02290, partial [Parcubacteria group bacterium QH_9_35_7]